MKRDPKSNYNITEVYAAASVGASTVTTSAINHGLMGPSVSYLVSCGTWATSFVATLQHSADGSTDWTAEADATYGNTVTLTLTEADSGLVHCPNPRRQYTRLSMVLGGTCVISVTAIAGPLPHIAVTDA